ncbi:hypothetical protein [Streptomyces globisporus]
MGKRIRKFYALAGMLGLFTLGGLGGTHGAAAVSMPQGGLTAPVPGGDSGHIDWP